MNTRALQFLTIGAVCLTGGIYLLQPQVEQRPPAARSVTPPATKKTARPTPAKRALPKRTAARPAALAEPERLVPEPDSKQAFVKTEPGVESVLGPDGELLSTRKTEVTDDGGRVEWQTTFDEKGQWSSRTRTAFDADGVRTTEHAELRLEDGRIGKQDIVWSTSEEGAARQEIRDDLDGDGLTERVTEMWTRGEKTNAVIALDEDKDGVVERKRFLSKAPDGSTKELILVDPDKDGRFEVEKKDD